MTSSLTALDRAHVWHPFTQADEWERQENLVIVRGDGVWLEDDVGRRYLDGTASLWCNVLGHRHPRVDAAVRAQLDAVAHTTLLGLTHPPAIHLAARLAALTGLPRVFYSDSGSTAVEVALKMAFQAQQQRGERARTRFAALREAYHGDTLGSVSVGGIDLFHAVYRPLLFDAVRIPAPDRPDPEVEARMLGEAERIFRDHGSSLCAFVFEPLVQGAAGMRTHSEAFLSELCAMARRAGALLVADEVATGFGRTGSWFASTGLRPDFLCVAKGLTGGYLPLAATLTTDDVYDAFRGPYGQHRTFFHGHTYTGNPLACAAALATLDVLAEERVVEGVPARAEALRRRLADVRHPAVAEHRQRGLMAALVLEGVDPAARVGHAVALATRREGAIVRNLGDAVVVMPPLVASEAELCALVDAVERALHRVLPVSGG
jgi:adenosylmethionine-8-amino-7-oxononanoate aminotransferase